MFSGQPKTLIDGKPDLFIGLVGAVGTDLRATSRSIEQAMSGYGYRCVFLRLSDLIRSSPLAGLAGHTEALREDDRISSLMDSGNRIRSIAKDSSAVSWLAIKQIAAHRKANQASSGSVGTCFVLNSLKHKAEVDLLKRIYNRSFFAISVYSPLSERLAYLKNAISKSHKQPLKKSDFEGGARELIRRDQNEPDNPFGQNVRDAFCQADLFVRAGAPEKSQIERFLSLLFGDPRETPTIEEHAMFVAKAASLRSADLSRQVGASIVTKQGQVVSVGCNEVPKSGGGHFWPGHDEKTKDDRDHNWGVDPNARMIRDMVAEVLRDFIQRKWIRESVAKSNDVSALIESLFRPAVGQSLKELRAGSIIEFGRIVHAEMSAVCDAALRGVAVEGCTLICTTFPCHMCARHLIASGISRVIYIEPYPKSLTAELYEKSILVEAEQSDGSPCGDRVVFASFVGVSPNRFAELFSYRVGKDAEGYAVEWKPDTKMTDRKSVV